jgi:arabinogalactan oligomer/maltooligosaccharide transport system substrate-binding protein
MRNTIFIATLFLILCFSFIAEAQVEVTLWHSYRGTEKQALEQVIDNFNAENKETNVKLLAIPYDAFADKITAAIPRGKGPDLFIFAHDRIGGWVAADILEPIDFYLEENIADQFIEGTFAPMKYDGSVYGLPMALKSTILFYNTDLIPDPPKTTDEMIELAKKHTNEPAGKYGLVYEIANFYYHSCWLYGFGGSVFDKNDNPSLNVKENIQSFQFARNLFSEHKVVPPEVSNVLVTTLFNEGKAAMTINGPWFRGEIAEDVNYDIALLPVVSQTGDRAKPFMSSEGVIMSSKSQNKDASFEVMKYLTSLKAAKIMAKVGKQPVANKAAYQDPEIKEDKYIPKFTEQIQYAVPMPSIPEMTFVWSPATTAINQAVNGTSSPEEALNEAQEKVLNNLKAAGLR